MSIEGLGAVSNREQVNVILQGEGVRGQGGQSVSCCEALWIQDPQEMPILKIDCKVYCSASLVAVVWTYNRWI